jgi:hypothetical protein
VSALKAFTGGFKPVFVAIVRFIGYLVAVVAALGVLGAFGLVGLGIYDFAAPALQGGHDDSCKRSSKTGPIPAQGKPKWRLKKLGTGDSSVTIGLDDYVDTARQDTAFVEVVPVRRRQAQPRLPKKWPIRAFILGGTLSDGTRSLGFRPRVTYSRAPDGSGVNVCVSAERPSERTASKPGTYEGKVRVTGKQVQAVDIPAKVQIKASRIETALLALLVAVISALIVFTTQRQSDEDEEEAKKSARYRALGYLPLITGIIAGLAAALVVYGDDPTWGAERGADTLKLITATFAAAAVGLTASVPATRGAQKRLKKPDAH